MEIGAWNWAACRASALRQGSGDRAGRGRERGKSAMVGEAGELEHAAAIPPEAGRAAGGVSRKAAPVPSSKKMGSPGQVLDVPAGPQGRGCL
ncbi:MAG: amino acid synthesis family protein [Paracoccaceae bacterium]